MAAFKMSVQDLDSSRDLDAIDVADFALFERWITGLVADNLGRST